MEDAAQAIAIRNRIVGALVRRARLRAGRNQKECASLLGCSLYALIKYEQGQWGLSLAQLETLARFFQVPLASLLDITGPPADEPEDPDVLQQAMFLRRKMIAVQLRQYRKSSELSQHEMAHILDHSTTRIGQYERGERDIPLSELEVAAERYGRTLADFMDEEPVPTGETQTDWEHQALASLNELPPEVREFCLKPTNALYVRIALLLSSMKADSLRQIAETLLDITY